MLGRDLWAVEAKRMDPDRQQAKRFNSINTQPIVPDCLTIDFVNTTWKADVAERPERERNVEQQAAPRAFFYLKQPAIKSEN